jgi:hypothetical protein
MILSGTGPQVLQQPGQEVAVRIARGQMHPDAATGFQGQSPRKPSHGLPAVNSEEPRKLSNHLNMIEL